MYCFMELTRRSCLNTSGMIYSAKRMNLSFCLPGRKKNPDNPVNPVKKTKPLSVPGAFVYPVKLTIVTT